MKTYIIYHPTTGLNRNCNEHIGFRKICSLEANSLQEAFQKGQNDYEDYASYMARSTSVGDLIVDPMGRRHMVLPMGFKLLDQQPHAVSDRGDH